MAALFLLSRHLAPERDRVVASCHAFIAVLTGCCSNWFAAVPERRRVHLED
jgi:hypothetical protein